MNIPEKCQNDFLCFAFVFPYSILFRQCVFEVMYEFMVKQHTGKLQPSVQIQEAYILGLRENFTLRITTQCCMNILICCRVMKLCMCCVFPCHMKAIFSEQCVVSSFKGRSVKRSWAAKETILLLKVILQTHYFESCDLCCVC